MGGTDNARQLVDYAKCLAHPAARCEVPAYLSAFVYPVEFRRHLETTGSTRDYRGPVGVPSVKWDIDRDGNLDAALNDTRRLAAFLADRYRLDADDLLIGFSGSKGFHVELPIGWMVEASPDANMICRLFAERAANDIGVVIDSGVYDKVRPFRAWNSKHPRTGLRKIRIELDDLLVSSAASITRGPSSRSHSTRRSPRYPLRCLPPGTTHNATSGAYRQNVRRRGPDRPTPA